MFTLVDDLGKEMYAHKVYENVLSHIAEKFGTECADAARIVGEFMHDGIYYFIN